MFQGRKLKTNVWWLGNFYPLIPTLAFLQYIWRPFNFGLKYLVSTAIVPTYACEYSTGKFTTCVTSKRILQRYTCNITFLLCTRHICTAVKFFYFQVLVKLEYEPCEGSDRILSMLSLATSLLILLGALWLRQRLDEYKKRHRPSEIQLLEQDAGVPVEQLLPDCMRSDMTRNNVGAAAAQKSPKHSQSMGVLYHNRANHDDDDSGGACFADVHEPHVTFGVGGAAARASSQPHDPNNVNPTLLLTDCRYLSDDDDDEDYDVTTATTPTRRRQAAKTTTRRLSVRSPIASKSRTRSGCIFNDLK